MANQSRSNAVGKLTAASLKRLPNGWHGDGGNLYFFVRGASRTWVFRYVSPTDGTRKNMGLGSLNTVSLAAAREAAQKLRASVKNPLEPQDPLATRQAERDQRRVEESLKYTFEQATDAFLESKQGEWRNPKHAAQWGSTLRTYAFPVMAKLPVAEINIGHVLQVLEPIWRGKTETASRLRGRIEAVLDWATVRKYREGDNPARWKGHLEHTLPAPRKVAKPSNHASLDHQEIGDFMATLRSCEGMGARALEFTILTAARSGEVRGALWSEIDMVQGVWTVPAERMKAGKEHRVPLAAECIRLLKSLPKIDGNDIVFPGARSEAPMSDMTLAAVLKRLGRGDLTVHGFRSTFRMWSAERTSMPREVCEAALAHRLKDRVEAAYQRSDHLEKRRQLMDSWARYCGTPSAAQKDNVRAIGGKGV